MSASHSRLQLPFFRSLRHATTPSKPTTLTQTLALTLALTLILIALSLFNTIANGATSKGFENFPIRLQKHPNLNPSLSLSPGPNPNAGINTDIAEDATHASLRAASFFSAHRSGAFLRSRASLRNQVLCQLRGGCESKPKIKPVFGGSPGNAKTGNTSKTRGEADEDSDDAVPDRQGFQTGEEEELCIYQQKAALFRMVDGKEWKQRAVGPCSMLKNRETGKIRVTVRDDAIWKIRANHYIIPGTVVVRHASTPTAFVYSTQDFAENATDPTTEIFCFKFDTEEDADNFYSNFTAATKINEEIFNKELGDHLASSPRADEDADEEDDEDYDGEDEDDGDYEGDDEDAGDYEDDEDGDYDESEEAGETRPDVPGLKDGDQDSEDEAEGNEGGEGEAKADVVDLTSKIGDVKVEGKDEEEAEE